MSSSRNLALLLALGLAAATAGLAQSSSSSSNTGVSSPDQASPQQTYAPTTGPMSVEARIRARREQRRAAAIHAAYDHRYEGYFGMGYLRFTPGATLERAHEYAWNFGITRYFNERLGITADGRGYFATAYVYNNALTNSAITNPAISEYAALVGPMYRFYVQPKFSVSGRVMAGVIYGNFSGDLGPYKPAQLGLWPDGSTYAASISIPVEYNLTPRVGLRLAPEYFLSGFGSTTQNSLGFTTGMVYRFGRQ
ncbi:MAG: hypothetical protein ACP5FH_00240 [Terracidiphilus sp.]